MVESIRLPRSKKRSTRPADAAVGNAATTTTATAGSQALRRSSRKAVSTATATTTATAGSQALRRSSRIVQNANAPPTVRQLMAMDMEDAFARKSPAKKPRTRATTHAFRAPFEEDTGAHKYNGDDDDGDEDYEDDNGPGVDEEEDQDVDVDVDDGVDEGSMDGHGECVDGSAGSDSRHRGRKKVPRLDNGKKVKVAGPARVHASWDDWTRYLTQYSAATHQVIVIEYTTNVAIRNGRIAEQKTPQPFVPEELGPYERQYICTHGWRNKKRLRKSRKRQHVRALGCPFCFRVQWQQVGGVWCLVVVDKVMHHNHQLDRETFEAYPVARGIEDPNTAELVSQLIEHGVGRSSIYDTLLVRGENVFQNDVDNIVDQQRAELEGVDDRSATAAVLADFAAKNDGCAVSTYQTPTGEAGVINISSHHMRAMFERFGELLLVDCTHKTNK